MNDLKDKYDHNVIKLAQKTQENMVENLWGDINSMKSNDIFFIESDDEEINEFLFKNIEIENIILNWSKTLEIEAEILEKLLADKTKILKIFLADKNYRIVRGDTREEKAEKIEFIYNSIYQNIPFQNKDKASVFIKYLRIKKQ